MLQQSVGLVIKRFKSQPCTWHKNSGQVFHTYVPVSPNSIGTSLRAEKVTVGLAESNDSLPPGL